jgi:hypothetical protein
VVIAPSSPFLFEFPHAQLCYNTLRRLCLR